MAKVGGFSGRVMKVLQEVGVDGDGVCYDGADTVMRFGSATDYEDGVKAITKTPTGNTSHVLRINIGGTYGYIPVYDDEACNADD